VLRSEPRGDNRGFRTIDFLTFFDLESLSPAVAARYLAGE